jgi:DHA2 family multidrug resistance protein
MGSSIGISVVTMLLTRNTQIMHSQLAEHINPFGDSLSAVSAQTLSTTAGLAAINASVMRQAAMIAYDNDFKLMLVLTLCAVPLVVLLRPAAPVKSAEPPVIE